MNSGSLSRRKFIGITAALGAGMLLSACDADDDVTEEPEAEAADDLDEELDDLEDVAETDAVLGQFEGTDFAEVITDIPDQFSQSPILDDEDLPPVEERLPSEPLVVRPIEIGQYGGNLRVGDVTTNLIGGEIGAVGGLHQLLLRINPDVTGYEPNIASEIEISDDATTFTLTLREGMRWSDGELVTSRDVEFAYNDIKLGGEIVPSPFSAFVAGGEVMEVSAPDDMTVVFEFAVPNPHFPLGTLAHYFGDFQGQQVYPAHYLEQFHIDYNPQAEEEAQEEGYSSWTARFLDMSARGVNPELPTLGTFIIDDYSTTVVNFRRNPYFWQVDSEGQQLPYFDTAQMERLQEMEAYHAQIVTGNYDVSVFHSDVLNFTTYESGAEEGDYRIILFSSARGGEMFFQFNFTYGDEVLREIFRDVRFRRAMSLAIDREEINQLLFFGQATPRQMTVVPESTYFRQEYADAYAQFDPEEANALLDEMGLEWDDAGNRRLRPDGEPLQINFSYHDFAGPKTPILNLVIDFWLQVGVQVDASSVTRELLATRVETNEEPMSLWHGDASTDLLLPIDRKWITGTGTDESTIAPFWNQWWQTNGAEGEEPEDWYRELLDTWAEFAITLDPDLAAHLLEQQAENLWSIGTVGMSPWPLIVKNSVRNVPEFGFFVWDSLFVYPYHPQTWFHAD